MNAEIFKEGYVVLPLKTYEELIRGKAIEEAPTPKPAIAPKEQPKTLEPIKEEAAKSEPVAMPQKKKTKKSSKKTEASPKAKVDHGKINALYNAGWNAEKIADEMRISVATVYNHVENPRRKRKG